jgi:hypothetical protein
MNGTFVLMALTLLGCSSAAAAAHRAHVDTDCPEASIKVTELEDDRYRAVGCNETRIYQCQDDSCAREGWFADNARDRGSRELGCSPGKIGVRWVQRDEYRVEGCGKGVTYICWDSGCSPRTGVSSAP